MEMMNNPKTPFQLKHHPYYEISRKLLEHRNCDQGGGKRFGPSNGWYANIIILDIIQIKNKPWGCFFGFVHLGACSSKQMISLAVLLLSACI